MLSGIIPTHSRLVRLSHVLDRQSRLGYGTLFFWRCMFEQMGPGWFASARLTFEIMEQGTGAFSVLMIWCNTARHGAIYIEGAQAAYHGYLGWLLGAWRDFWLWESRAVMVAQRCIYTYLFSFGLLAGKCLAVDKTGVSLQGDYA